MAKPYVIWDLDNCLSDDAWRISFIEWGATDGDTKYGAYHSHCGMDSPGNLKIFAAFQLISQPVFFTGRPESERQATEDWIQQRLKVEGRPYVLMRPNGNHARSADIKRAQVMAFIQAHAALREILCAFDDREDIVAMYKDYYGIPSMVLNIHDVCAYTNPKDANAK